MKIVIIILTLLLTGCAHNSVSVTEWSSRTTLIDSRGNVYDGITVFGYATQTGTIDFTKSKYGALKGQFVASLNNYGVSVALSNQQPITLPANSLDYVSLRDNMGMVNLAHNGKDVLRCNFSVDFKTKGYGDAKMVGSGVCADLDGETWNILFG